MEKFYTFTTLSVITQLFFTSVAMVVCSFEFAGVGAGVSLNIMTICYGSNGRFYHNLKLKAWLWMNFKFNFKSFHACVSLEILMRKLKTFRKMISNEGA